MNVERISLSTWDDKLEGTDYRVFHQPDVLTVLEDHADGGELRLYGGFKGDHLVGLLPAFVKRSALGAKIVSSPPPGMHVPHLGPLVMPTSPKVRKCERVNQKFTEGVLEELGIDSRSLVFVVCSPEYADPRPYKWNDLAVDVSFTYDVPIGDRDPEEILRDFSKSRRREIREGEKLDLTVETGDIADAKRIYEQTQERFADQDEYFGLTWPFVRDVIEALDGRCRVYVARDPDGEFLTGIVVLYSSDAGSFWLGGVRTTCEGVSMNSLIHWAIIRDIAADPELDDINKYDMVGAGEYRLSRFKSKFAPDLRPYYVVNSGGMKMRAAESAYKFLKRTGMVWR